MADQGPAPVDYAIQYDALADDILGDDVSDSSEDFSWMAAYDKKDDGDEEGTTLHIFIAPRKTI